MENLPSDYYPPLQDHKLKDKANYQVTKLDCKENNKAAKEMHS